MTDHSSPRSAPVRTREAVDHDLDREAETPANPERPNPNSGRGHDDVGSQRGDRVRQRTWTPWLVIRSNPTDTGVSRPLASGEVFWVSPDIWVQSSDPAGNAKAGEENHVFARIFNIGKAHSRPTRVDFYWANPSVGLGVNDVIPIGSAFVEVGHLRTWTVSVPWWPVFENNGHECLLVNCSNDLLDPIAYSLRPTLDRHAGQRNVTVVAAKPGQLQTFPLWTTNPAPMTAATLITARMTHVALAAREGRTRLTRNDQLTRIIHNVQGASVMREREDFQFGAGAPSIRSMLSERISSAPSVTGRRYFGELLARSNAGAGRTRADAVLHDLQMGAFERRQIQVEIGVPAGARPGEFVVCHIMQSIEGLSVGGYTIVIEIQADHAESDVRRS
jgi:hypothetical protein